MNQDTNNSQHLEASEGSQGEAFSYTHSIANSEAEEQVNIEDVVLNIPNENVKAMMELAKATGFTYAPVLPYYSMEKYPQYPTITSKKTNPETGEVTEIVRPKFNGKRVGFIQEDGTPTTIKWEEFKTDSPTDKRANTLWRDEIVGIVFIGNALLRCVDFDKRKDKETQDELDKRFHLWRQKVEAVIGSKFRYGKSPNGGYRALLRLTQDPKCYKNFVQNIESKETEVELKGASHCNMWLAQTQNSKPYTFDINVNEAQIIEIKCVEDIGLYPLGKNDIAFPSLSRYSSSNE